jgi:hypothetical protein
MYNTITGTYTVVDIRKTFEGFDADLRMIAARTEKLSTREIADYIHDILILAENKYLKRVDIVLIDKSNSPIIASKFTINDNGSASQGDRAGNNNWRNIPDSQLTIVLHYSDLWKGMTPEDRDKFRQDNGFKVNWRPSSINTAYTHLSREDAQLYASKGYELKKENYK